MRAFDVLLMVRSNLAKTFDSMSRLDRFSSATAAVDLKDH